MENFSLLGLPEALLHSITAMKFETPTPIQAQTIPHALQGLDVIGTAQTGTGKTAAYGIPLVSYLINNPTAMAIVLVPTRELAVQVTATMRQLIGRNVRIDNALLIGGDSMFRQLNALKLKPRLIVGTPGRINDHLERRTLKLDAAKFLVLDETDRMLDMGFAVQIQDIIKFLPKERQTLMFSATMAPNIVKIAQNYLKDAIRVAVGSSTAPIEKIKQESVQVSESEKFSTLLTQLDSIENSCIIFVKTKFGADKLANKLDEEGFLAEAIHGDLRQSRREKVIKSFREGKSQILVATDIAARGLDVPSIECVINYDLPMCPEDYIHRIGRTGRNGAEGRAISFISNADRDKWRSICRLIDTGDTSECGGNARRGGGGSKGGFRSQGGGFGNRRPSGGRGGFGGGDKSRFGSRPSYKPAPEY